MCEILNCNSEKNITTSVKNLCRCARKCEPFVNGKNSWKAYHRKFFFGFKTVQKKFLKWTDASKTPNWECESLTRKVALTSSFNFNLKPSDTRSEKREYPYLLGATRCHFHQDHFYSSAITKNNQTSQAIIHSDFCSKVLWSYTVWPKTDSPIISEGKGPLEEYFRPIKCPILICLKK